MLDQLHTIVHALNDITPLGLAAGLAFVIYQIVGKGGWGQTLTNNHLSGLPEIQASLERIEETLVAIRDDMNYLKGRLNGK